MRRPLPVALTLVALLAALIVAGCGSSKGGETDAKSYQKALDTTSAAQKKTFASIGSGLTSGSSLTALSAALDRGAKALDSAADDFDEITPPDKAKDAHVELVAGLHELADSFASSAKVTRSGSSAKIATAMQSIATSSGTKKITDAEAKLKKAGFTPPGGAPGSS
jgi:uncharacterized lipoprotein